MKITMTILGEKPKFNKASMVSKKILGYSNKSKVIIHNGKGPMP